MVFQYLRFSFVFVLLCTLAKDGIMQNCSNDSLIIDTINLIPNPSFSELVNTFNCLPNGSDCPPAYFTLVECVPEWVQGNAVPATNDVISLCHAQNVQEDFLPYFQNGDEAIGGGYIIIEPLTQTYGIEYFGNTFSEPLQQDSTYRFSVQLNLGFTFDTGLLLNSYTVSQIGKFLRLSLFGNTTNNNFPYPEYSGYCPDVVYPNDYVELATTDVTISGANEWIQIDMEFVAPTTINHFIFGPSCTQPDLDIIDDDDLLMYMFNDSFKLIQIFENPYFNNLDIALETTIDPCSNDATFIAPDFPDGSYQWYFEEEVIAMTSDNNLLITNQAESEGLYFVEVFDGMGNCGFSDTLLFIYENLLSFDAMITDVDCAGDSTGQINVAFSNTDDLSFTWTDIEGQLVSTTQNLINIPEGQYFLEVLDENGCIYNADYIVATPAPLNLSANTVETGCINENLGLIEVLASGGTMPYVYRIDNSVFSNDNIFERPAGIYTITTLDENGCEAILTGVSISPGIPFVIDIQASDNPLQLGAPLQLSINSNRPLSESMILWNLPTPSDCENCASITTSIFETTPISVEVIDSSGCTAAASVLISVEKNRAVFIPNAFSPNDDGLNDIFQIYSGQAVSAVLNFQVFNRWGALMYNNPVQGWDGTFKNQAMPEGVYTWFAEILFLDGHRQLYRGDVSLVR